MGDIELSEGKCVIRIVPLSMKMLELDMEARWCCVGSRQIGTVEKRGVRTKAASLVLMGRRILCRANGKGDGDRKRRKVAAGRWYWLAESEISI